ncbi:MAG: CpsB/CapC family capsule biosynthesis tyrosine phosphatase [Gaiellaceae bacterium]
MRPAFVDCHSHVVPSGDDGAKTIEEGLALCGSAAEHGTRILYATPHVWPHLPLTAERETAVRAAFEQLRERAPLELRLGFELTPAPALLEEDLRRYALEGMDAVLIELEFVGGAELLLACCERAAQGGLVPVVAHPERTEALRRRPALGADLATRGYLVQVNATSLLGYHGEEAEDLGWSLVEDGVVALVASDGHRAARPAHLDDAFSAVWERVGEKAAALFDGSALGFAPSPPSPTPPLPSRAGERAA